MKKIALFGFLGVAFAFAQAASAEANTVETHVLTLDVRVGDQQVMQPMVELFADKPASIQVSDPQTGERYTLRLLLKANQKFQQVENGIVLESELLAGSDPQRSLFNPILFLRPGRGGKVSMTAPDGDRVIEVLTHAVKVRTVSDRTGGSNPQTAQLGRGQGVIP